MIPVRNPRPAGLSQTQADGEERAAIIYQHHARGADTVITRAIDAHADSELRRDDGDGSSAGGLSC
jgi:hypothetical protein